MAKEKLVEKTKVQLAFEEVCQRTKEPQSEKLRHGPSEWISEESGSGSCWHLPKYHDEPFKTVKACFP